MMIPRLAYPIENVLDGIRNDAKGTIESLEYYFRRFREYYDNSNRFMKAALLLQNYADINAISSCLEEKIESGDSGKAKGLKDSIDCFYKEKREPAIVCYVVGTLLCFVDGPRRFIRNIGRLSS